MSKRTWKVTSLVQTLTSRTAPALVGDIQFLIWPSQHIFSQVTHSARQVSTGNAYMQSPCEAIKMPQSLNTTVCSSPWTPHHLAVFHPPRLCQESLLPTPSVSLNVLSLASSNSQTLSQSFGLLGDVRSSWTLGVTVNRSWYHVT